VISIVIPAFDEGRRIGAQLEALAEQMAPDDCEVIVADNGSRDDTVAVVRSWEDRLPVRVVDASARRGQAAARNVAVADARGDLLVFVDADDVVMPGFVDAWRRVDRDASVELASGPVVFFRHDQSPPRDRRGAPRGLPMHMGFLPYALGANFAVRRSRFEQVGGFDESYPPAEDVELSWRLQLARVPLVFVPDAVVAKREARNLGATLRQYYRYGRRDPVLYRDYRRQGVPAPSGGAALRSYVGLLVRVPMLWRTESRRRWAHQLGRRAGRLVGSAQVRTWYP
jgi:GT2 family glycosyltransferase